MKRSLALCALFIQLAAFAQDVPKTLAKFKERFLGQPVVVNGNPYDNIYCSGWHTAFQNGDGTYKKDDSIDVRGFDNLPIGYREKVGTVIAIQLAPSILQKTQAGSTNAFGETIGENEISNPYLEVVVKFADGQLGLASGFPDSLVPFNMELATERKSLAATISSKLPSVVGKKLFAVGFTRLYKPTATIEELSGTHPQLVKLSILDIPLLEPLTITKAKYLPDVNAVLLKLSLPNGAEAIAYTPLSVLHDSTEDFFSRISVSLLSSIPRNLTARDIAAIKGRTLYRGMSSDLVSWAIGFKESENDWGRGGKQLVYFDGKLLVYINNSNKVEDWQTLQ